MKTSTLLQWWDRVRSGLIDTIDKFHDADLDFAPFDGAYSVRQLVLHIAQEEYGEVHFGITRQIAEFPPAYPIDSYPTVATAKALLADVHEGTTRFVGSLTDAQLAEEVEAGWGGTYVLENMILHVIEHEIHHRAELSLILGLLGRVGLDA